MCKEPKWRYRHYVNVSAHSHDLSLSCWDAKLWALKLCWHCVDIYSTVIYTQISYRTLPNICSGNSSPMGILVVNCSIEVVMTWLREFGLMF